MIAFLPVARYGVEYQVASGRPFSSFERLMLAAIHGGNGTLESLADLFRLHRRMVIEGVVTLMQAGWVCLAPDGSSFITTDSGRMACAESEELSSPASGIEKHVSIRLANCAVGAKFCDFIADLASKEEKIRISSAVTSLRKAAATLREVAAVANRPAGTDPESLMANVFFGEAGDWYCGELIEYATTSISITVSSIDPGQAAEASKQLSSAATRVSDRVTIEFGGAPLEHSLSSPLMSNETDVAFVSRPEMRANVIVVDGRSLLIGNRSWFDKRESRVRPYGSRVALAIQGPGIPGMTEARLGFSNSK